MKKLKMLVIGNYTPDKQISMEQYCDIVANIYNGKYETQISKPGVYLGKLKQIGTRYKKYINYIDKLIIYPLWLAVNSKKYDKVHIIDQGNAYYSIFCPWYRTIITCHDLLAIRGAMGDKTLHCKTSITGIFLQRLIRLGLQRAKYICFVSYSTYRDYQSIIGNKQKQIYKVIYNPLNAIFTSDKSKTNYSDNDYKLMTDKPYILMVGSSHPRKNRKISINVVSKLGTKSPYKLILAGDKVSSEEKKLIEDLGIRKKVLSYINPNHELLNYLYCNAHALIFPSYGEGFGWPIIEAQSARCPVIASNRTSIPEIAGKGALFSDPDDVDLISNYILFLEVPKIRIKLINLGTANIQRYELNKISDEYIALVHS